MRLRSIWFFIMTIACILSNAQTKILMRMDDMGISHGTNVATIEAYKNGVGSSVEIIVPGPWFEEAVLMLNQHPDLDVGIHLTLSSEWSHLKWRPLTTCPSLVDKDGYLLPMIWPNPAYTDDEILHNVDWELVEIEKELRAQIELALKKIPRITHLTAHMGCMDLHEDLQKLWHRLGEEYNLKVVPINEEITVFPKWGGNELTAKQKERQFLKNLDQLENKTYVVVGHLATESKESRAIGHRRTKEIASPRSGDFYVFTSKKIRKALNRKNIQVISYKDL